MILKSTSVLINENQENIFLFLSDSSNLFHILPIESISDWKANSTECSFKVQGGVIISLVQDGFEGKSKIFMKSGEKSPFPFKLTLNLEKIENQTQGYIEFDGELNKFLKMMVEKPLTNLFNYMSEKLKTHFEH
jgi:hypothetical protein